MTTPTETTGPAGLYRPAHGRLLAGVAAGLADYLDVDVALVRLGFVVLAVVGGLGIPLYLAGWLLLPDEGATTTVATDLLDQLRHDRRA